MRGTSRSATTPTTSARFPTASAMARAASTETKRGLLGTKLSPIDETPQARQPSASSTEVTPQTFT